MEGETFDPEAEEGRNATFPFTTWDGPSVSTPGGADVLKIDDEHPQSPWMVRDLLDGLVRIDDELFLGQALLRIRGRPHRIVWFELRRRSPA